MADVTITIKGKRKLPILQQPKKGPLSIRRDSEFLPRRLRPQTCSWTRDFTFSLDNYRVWTALVDGTNYIYNGTAFTGVTRTGITLGSESLNIGQGWNDGFTGIPAQVLEAFDPDAVPDTGSVTLSINKTTGAGTLTTPHGSYSFSCTSDSGFWVATIQLRNYWVQAVVFQFGGTAGLTATAAPNWVHYTGTHFTISRSGTEFTITGVSYTDAIGQGSTEYKGTYTPPIPSPCDSATADAQAELARQSFEDQITELPFLRNIVFD